jgi:hypothetical protein
MDVADYIIRGSVRDNKGNPIGSIKVQAMDSDQQWFDDRNDDLIGSMWVKNDGTFEIPFDRAQFEDGWFEGNPDIYLIIRNSLGEGIHITEVRRGVKPSDIERLTFNIILDSMEKKIEPPEDPYVRNNERVMASFMRIGDTIDLNVGDTARTFRLLISAINAWTLYTREEMWRTIGYDGPQVPRYPWKEAHMPHRLAWERK